MEFRWGTNYFLRPPFTVQIAKTEDIDRMAKRLAAMKKEMKSKVPKVKKIVHTESVDVV